MNADPEANLTPPVNSSAGNLIHVQVVVQCAAAEAFLHFTDPAFVATRLADLAQVDPEIGGKYEIFWDSPPALSNRATSGCKITVLVPVRLLGFDWIGPTMFDDAMNVIDPATHVLVVFLPIADAATEVHLVHSGWGHSPRLMSRGSGSTARGAVRYRRWLRSSAAPRVSCAGASRHGVKAQAAALRAGRRDLDRHGPRKPFRESAARAFPAQRAHFLERLEPPDRVIDAFTRALERLADRLQRLFVVHTSGSSS